MVPPLIQLELQRVGLGANETKLLVDLSTRFTGYLPKIHSQVSPLHLILKRLDLVPPKGRHEENVPWSEDTVHPSCFGKIRKSLQVWVLDVHRRHDHGGAFKKGVPVKFAS